MKTMKSKTFLVLSRCGIKSMELSHGRSLAMRVRAATEKSDLREALNTDTAPTCLWGLDFSLLSQHNCPSLESSSGGPLGGGP